MSWAGSNELRAVLDRTRRHLERNGLQVTGKITVPVTAETASRIRERIAHPVRAGALATVLITGVGYGTLVSIPLTALSDRADVLLLESRRRAEPGAYASPSPARPLLLAARTFAAVRGTEPHHACSASQNLTERRCWTASTAVRNAPTY